MAGNGGGKGGGARKVGRNKAKCDKYKSSNRLAKNKEKNIKAQEAFQARKRAEHEERAKASA